MDDKNNRLEEFFNQSLNQFDDSPSDAVWEGLQDRLDSERTFLEVWTHNIRKYLPYLLLLLALGAYHLYAQNKYNKIVNELAAVHTDKLALDTQLKDCSDQQSKLLTDLNSKSKELQSNAASMASMQQASLTKTTALSNSIAKLRAEVQKSTPPISVSTNGADNTSFSGNTPILTTLPFVGMDDKKNIVDKSAALTPPLLDTRDLEQSKENSRKITPLNLLPVYLKRKEVFSVPLGGFYINGQHNKLLIDPIRSEESAKFRIGYQGRGFITFAGKNNKLIGSLGNSNGLIMEILFKNNFSITGGINYNFQHYKITAGSTVNIPVSDLLKYPGGSNFGNQVTALRVHSDYVDFPLGIKWNSSKSILGFNFYINPALVWQVYTPQRFTYTLDNSTDIDRRTGQFFGYFGSGNLQVGLEKVIRNNLVWQIGLWGEKSFTPLGIENQGISMLGINTAFLFQK